MRSTERRRTDPLVGTPSYYCCPETLNRREGGVGGEGRAFKTGIWSYFRFYLMEYAGLANLKRRVSPGITPSFILSFDSPFLLFFFLLFPIFRY